MILERGNMWDIFGKTDCFFITTNPIARNDGAIVMGRGIAKEMKDRFPEFPYKFGEKLATLHDQYSAVGKAWTPTTGAVGSFNGQLCGYFMTKSHWRERSDTDVIKASVHSLFSLCEHHPVKDFRFDLNFPGIGNGKLKREDVLPLLEELPDNVHVWEYA